MVYERIQRAIDILGGLVGITVFSPVFILAALAIKRGSPGPIIFVQKRMGKGGRAFGMYKFRSMVQNAEEILNKDPELLKKYREGSYKLRVEEDPRITRAGRLLRRTSMDELPQLFNILRGEMSLVGPRAYKPDEIRDWRRKHPGSGDVKLLLAVKPGLTGLWQVSGRSEIDFAERVRLDAAYVKKKSLWGDVKILLRTPWVVIGGKGAY